MVKPYHELHRPQFHFTAKKDWINDPNGLVYYKGEYHLFFQHSPGFIGHAPNTWGHAISLDLVHWTQIEPAIEPDDYGWIWSGSAVVDWHNTSGLQEGDEAVIVAFYTTGGFGDPPTPCVQSIAYSNDCGRTFTKYPEPVLDHIRAHNRDPKVSWHEASEQWIMALYLDGDDFSLFSSKNLKHWERLCDVEVGGTGECPDLYELPVDGESENTRWVLWGAAGTYRIGTFDGQAFIPETNTLRAELGLNGYAAQTWSDIPTQDGRLIQISWMQGGHYPAMPFNQQMSFPVELSLRTTTEGIRLFRQPVRELEILHTHTLQWTDYTLKSGLDRQAVFKRYGPTWQDELPHVLANLAIDTSWDLFDIRIEFEVQDAKAFGAIIRGHHLVYDAVNEAFTYLEQEIPAKLDDNGRLRLQLLVDRTSLELFASNGQVSASFCFLPGAHDTPLEFYAREGSVRLISLTVHELAATWN